MGLVRSGDYYAAVARMTAHSRTDAENAPRHNDRSSCRDPDERAIANLRKKQKTAGHFGDTAAMAYYIATTVQGPFDRVLADVIERLKEQGFGVLTDIDVQATLKSKIGADMGRYRILGACNPAFAHEALKLEDKLGVLLPCNVIVRETADGRIEVASVDPVVAMERTENPALATTAKEVRHRLSAVIGALA